jgi:hypothetical protein
LPRKLTDRALAALAAGPGLANIATLRLGNNRKLTAAGLEALRERFGQKRINASERNAAGADFGAVR